MIRGSSLAIIYPVPIWLVLRPVKVQPSNISGPPASRKKGSSQGGTWGKAGAAARRKGNSYKRGKKNLIPVSER
jgi:hypothetical protein